MKRERRPRAPSARDFCDISSDTPFLGRAGLGLGSNAESSAERRGRRRRARLLHSIASIYSSENVECCSEWLSSYSLCCCWPWVQTRGITWRGRRDLCMLLLRGWQEALYVQLLHGWQEVLPARPRAVVVT